MIMNVFTFQALHHDETWEPCSGRETTRAHEEWGYCQEYTPASSVKPQPQRIFRKKFAFLAKDLIVNKKNVERV
jgi:hypothetical protein